MNILTKVSSIVMTKRLPKSGLVFLRRHFFVLLVIIVFLLVACARQFLSYQSLLARVSGAKNEILKFETNKATLVTKIEQYASIAFLEAEARNKLNLKKKGETVVVIKNIPVLPLPVQEGFIANETSAQIVEKQKTNLELWWKYFFKN